MNDNKEKQKIVKCGTEVPYLSYLLRKKFIEKFFISFEVFYEDNFEIEVSTFTTSYFLSIENLLETAVAYMELINKGTEIPTRKRGVYRVPVGFRYYGKGNTGGYGWTPRFYKE